MSFQRLEDDVDPDFNCDRVTYQYEYDPDTIFTITITRYGIQMTGATPRFTDQQQYTEVLDWALRQFSALKVGRRPLPQTLVLQGLFDLGAR